MKSGEHTGGPITEAVERELLRLLTDPAGEQGLLAPERAAELRRQLAEDAHLAARLRRLRRTWEALELPPAQPLPPGFAQRVAARAAAERSEAEAPLGWSTAPGWVRAVGAAALAAGVLLGSQILPAFPAAPEASLPEAAIPEALGELTLVETEPSLAEAYVAALEEFDDRPGPGPGSPETDAWGRGVLR